MFGFFRICFVLLASIASFVAMPVSAYADQATTALTQASKYLEQDAPDRAIVLINAAIKSGRLPSDLAARAMLMRAQAHERLAKDAYALADYNQALWMQKLSQRDKGRAEAGRKRIMAKLGVGGNVGAQNASFSQDNSRSAAPAQRAPRESSGGGIGGFFSGITNIFNSDEPERRQVRRPQPKPVQEDPALSDYQTVAQVRTSTTAGQADDASQGIASVNEGGITAGDYAIQMAALHSENDAIYEVNRIAKRYGEWFGGRSPSITIRATAGGGTLYKVIVEPYGRGEGTATCELLKTKGLSCMLISR